MEARLPPAKLTYMDELLVSWKARTHCSLHELQELTGFLQFASQVIPLARSFLQALYNFSAQFTSTMACRRLPAQQRRTSPGGIRPPLHGMVSRLLSPTCETVHVHTDASGSKGIEVSLVPNGFQLVFLAVSAIATSNSRSFLLSSMPFFVGVINLQDGTSFFTSTTRLYAQHWTS